MQYTPPEKDIKIEQKSLTTLNFKDILLPKRKKKSLFLSTSKAIFKKYLKIRRKKNELKSIKQVGMHQTDRLVRKVKNIASGKGNVYKTGSFTSAQQIKTCNKR